MNNYGKFISNNAYKSIRKYYDGLGMSSRVNSRKVKNRSKSKTVKVLQKSSLPNRHIINYMETFLRPCYIKTNH